MTKRILAVLNGQAVDRSPFWMMRQAGRYLPEYRALRAEAGGFLDLVYNPDFAAEVTVQPIERFGMDAAILFSDILVIPHALGQKLTFVQGEGPKLGTLDIESLDEENIHETLSPIYKTVSTVRNLLSDKGFDDVALIGFAGAPWTVITYMIEGGSSRDFLKTKTWAYRDPDGFAALMDLVTRATTAYLIKQAEAGAEVLKIFDSWAGVLDETLFLKFCADPIRRIVRDVKAAHPDVPVVGFAKGAGLMTRRFAEITGVDCVAIDPSVPLEYAAENLQDVCAVQGNLDPMCLLAGGDMLEKETQRILDILGKNKSRFIFNLGHGINKDTPIEHVEKMARLIKGR